MKVSARKVEVGRFYALVLDDTKRLLWACPHSHATRKEANACGRKQIRLWQKEASVPRPRVRRAGTNTFRPPTGSLVAPGNPLEFRRSFVESFLQCTEYQQDDGSQAGFGILVHDAIQAYLRACINKREDSRMKDLPAIMTEAFARHGGVHPDRFEEAAAMVEQFARTRLADWHRLLWRENVPCVEYKLATQVGDAWYTGTCDRIDRMDGDDPYDPPTRILITDYKTQWAKAQHTFQGRFYAELAFRMMPSLEGVAVLFDHLPLRNPEVWHPGKVDNQIAYFERGDLTAWLDDVIAIFQLRYKGPRGHPVGGSACQYCGLRKGCAAAEMTAESKPENTEQARELVGDWIRAQERAKALGDALEAHYKHHKPDVFANISPDPRPIIVGMLAPKKPTWRATDPVGIAGQLDKMGMDGKSTLATITNKDAIPYTLYDTLVVAGVARWDPGEVSFKKRLADEDE
jgi:hypothetical protein